MGGPKSGGSAGAAASQQAEIAKTLFAETGPLRGLLFGTPGTSGTPSGSALPAGFPGGLVDAGAPNPDPSRFRWRPIEDGGGLGHFFSRFPSPATGTPGIPGTPGTPGLLANLLTQPAGIFPAERDIFESQFGRAREGILSGGPARGGLQSTLLANLESERATGLTGLASMGQQRQIENIFRTGGLVTGQNQLSLGGLGSAAGTFGNIAGQQAALAGQLGQAAGLTAGLGMAGKKAGAGAGGAAAAAAPFGLACWIARALYGRRSMEAALARVWIFQEWQGPMATFCRFLYRRFGRRVARSPSALYVLRPWFDLAVQKARR